MLCTSVYIDHGSQLNLDSCDVLNSGYNVCMYKGAWGVVGCDHMWGYFNHALIYTF